MTAPLRQSAIAVEAKHALDGITDLEVFRIVEPEEVEEACFGEPLVLRARSEGPNPVYYVPGQTSVGRYLFCVIIQFPDGNGYPVTARTMTVNEERRYRERKQR